MFMKWTGQDDKTKDEPKAKPAGAKRSGNGTGRNRKAPANGVSPKRSGSRSPKK